MDVNVGGDKFVFLDDNGDVDNDEDNVVNGDDIDEKRVKLSFMIIDDDEEEEDNDDNNKNLQKTNLNTINHSSNASSNVGSVVGNDRSALSIQSSMFHLLSDNSKIREFGNEGEKKSIYKLKPLIIQEINEEIIADLESVYKGIADQAIDYIHAK